MRPARGLVLLKPVETQETLAGGAIVLLESTRERWTGQQAEVVSIGLPAECECEESPVHYHECKLHAGDWVIVEPRVFTELNDKLWLVPQDAVLARIVMQESEEP